MKQVPEIDFVITWVDSSDSAWLKKRAEYAGDEHGEMNCQARYRDWDTLKYWFRGVEKFAPWVRNIYFVTDNQKPEWLNIEHPKIRWVKHTDFIPQKYLPTFSSQVIEWNFHRIEGLSQQFVYFNDDVFLIKKTTPSDFFENGLPCDLPCLGPLYPEDDFSQILFNNIKCLNKHFSLKQSIKENPVKWIKNQPLSGILKLALYGRRDSIPNSVTRHIHTSFLKKTFFEVLEKEGELVDKTCVNKFRTAEDISQYLIRDWQIFKGDFVPQKPIGRAFNTAQMSYDNELISYLSKREGKVICINDTEDECDFEAHKKQIIDVFEKILPEKSSFER